MTTETKSYKDTVNLPKTDFDMRANAIKREPEIQQFWAENQIYERLSQNNPGDIFVLHDGPPYANGSLHIGHALNKILKDIINRYQLLKGRKVRYVPGWDCHGLPIELKVLQQMKPEERKNLTPLELRHKAKEFALNTVDEQRRSFMRYGVWGDWEHPYLTLKPEYEAAQIGVFGQMVLKGYIYRGLKPVHWSPSSKTALAEAELEYPEDEKGNPTHVSRSIYAAFPVVSVADDLQEALEPYLPELGVAVWTTTPWTIPANMAVAVNPDLLYAVVEVDQKGEKLGLFRYLIVANDLVERLANTFGVKLTVRAVGVGRSFENCTYKHPLYDRTSPIVIGGDYITTDSGTGLVHTAPGHGDEDFQVGKRYNLPAFSPVDADGNFTEEAGQFAGLDVLDKGNAAVVEALAKENVLLKEEPYRHKYPYDWRTKKPTIYRATEQWFASVSGFREQALEAISEVKWIPAQGENRITPMVAERSDWCISRQRNWGVPIPVFYDEKTGEPLLTEETISHVQSIVAEKGSDAWWELSVEELLPEKLLNNGKKYRKGTDTMDVWFDSGSSWAAVAEQRPELHYPAEIYLEGSDQHRGWFQSSLLTSVATNGIAPYKTVLTHGFVLDEQNRKMSKSLGNVVDPIIVIEGGKNQKEEPPYGADVLRLWVSSVDYSTDVPLGKNLLKQMADIRSKIRNTARFLLGNLHDFDPEKDAVPYEELPELDRYMLHRMTEVFSEVEAAFESFQFFRFFQTVQNFCVVDLSNFYLDVAKDRLYISAPDAYRRRSCQTVLAIALENLARAIAPVLCHTAEDIWQFIPYSTPYKSVFEAGWVKIDERWKNPQLANKWQQLRQLRQEVNKVMDQARSEKTIGSSLEAKVLLYVADEKLREQLAELTPEIVEYIPEAPAEPTLIDAKAYTPPGSIVATKYPVLQELNVNFGEFVRNYNQPLITIGLILAATITLYVIGGTLGVINRVPVLEPFFKTVGILYFLWYARSYLLFAKDREKWVEKVSTFKEEILGKTGEITEQKLLPEATEPEAITLLEVETVPQDLGILRGVDELRYLFISSQVELLDSPDALTDLQYKLQTENLGVGIVKADGEKCDRCWNYSVNVGKSLSDPLLCERCIPALQGKF
ncbi:isoleucine--tRNA ligase [Floridanema evergladense]|uniref:Isoleucine--tRNA ligase n=1 Tax=Floridaenema evergladense BLCC-F167 TaxID=3153639 RepID=A0ABV4WIS4_9CYAN